MSKEAVKVVAAIPARIGSTRFPRKVLADLNGHPMLWHVYHGVADARTVNDIVVLTDSIEIFNAVDSWGGRALMTSVDCPSGTDRIASVIQDLDADIVVNVQGDEPLIKGHVIDSTVKALESTNADVATPVYKLENQDEVANPNLVKVVRASDGSALYFSRSSVPHVRDAKFEDWVSRTEFWGHVGLYALRRNVLIDYPSLPEGELERSEKLEQLRLLEAGKRIMAVEINYRPVAVDVPSDLDQVKAILCGK